MDLQPAEDPESADLWGSPFPPFGGGADDSRGSKEAKVEVVLAASGRVVAGWEVKVVVWAVGGEEVGEVGEVLTASLVGALVTVGWGAKVAKGVATVGRVGVKDGAVGREAPVVGRVEEVQGGAEAAGAGGMAARVARHDG
ncbi:hypothetical protein PLESTB_000276900 [Pleodorina starrii]|uniref:Uncharacterized protein n=1 Tax=Pleodorina starrii TaxID=330485 RepID=A0A9W6EZ30_9CHLO|nr:hypothetical protein PLESTB_000276900 [Pleodorina starrii]